MRDEKNKIQGVKLDKEVEKYHSRQSMSLTMTNYFYIVAKSNICVSME